MRMKIRKMLALLMAVCVLLAVTPGTPSAYAAGSTKVLSSAAFHSFIVAYDENTRELSLEGNGKVPALSDETATPWSDYSTQITTLSIGEGITSIGSGAFAGLVNLDTVIFPSTIKFIETDAFVGCNNVTNIIFPGSMSYLEGLLSENSVRELLRSLNGESTRTTTNGRVRATESTKPRLVGNGNNTSGRGYNRGWDWDSGDVRDYHPDDQKQTKTPATEKTPAQKKTVTPSKETPKPEKEKPTPIPDYVKTNEQGQKIEEKVTQPDGTAKISKYTYSYEGEIQSISEQVIDKSGNVLSNSTTSMFKFDTVEGEQHVEGTTKETVYANGNIQIINKTVNTDKNGQKLSEKTTSETKDKNGTVIGKDNELNTYVNGELKKSVTYIEKNKDSIETTIDYNGEDGKDYGHVVTKINDQVTQYEAYTVEKNGNTVTTSGVIKKSENDPGSISTYTKTATQNEDETVLTVNHYTGIIDGKTGVNMTDTILYDKDEKFISGSRKWSDSEVKEGNVTIDEQGRITSGKVEYNSGSVDDITSVQYDGDGNSTKTGTYTESGSGKVEEYTENSSADGRNTIRKGTVTKPIQEGEKTYTLYQETNILEDGGKIVDRKETDPVTHEMNGVKNTYDADDKWLEKEESWAIDNEEQTTKFAVVTYTNDKGVENAFKDVGGSRKIIKDGKTEEEQFTYILDEDSTTYKINKRTGTLTITNVDGTKTVEEYVTDLSSRDINGYDTVKGTITTYKNGIITQVDTITDGKTSSDEKGDNVRSVRTISREKDGKTYTVETKFSKNGKAEYQYMSEIAEDGSASFISTSTKAEDGSITSSTVYYKREDGTENYTQFTGGKPTTEWINKDGYRTKREYAYNGDQKTVTTYQNNPDGTTEKVVEVLKTQEGSSDTTISKETIHMISNQQWERVYEEAGQPTVRNNIDDDDVNKSGVLNGAGASAPTIPSENVFEESNGTVSTNSLSAQNMVPVTMLAMDDGEATPLDANLLATKDGDNAASAMLGLTENPLEEEESQEGEELENQDEADTGLLEGKDQESEENSNPVSITLDAFGKVVAGTRSKLKMGMAAPSLKPTDETLVEDGDNVQITGDDIVSGKDEQNPDTINEDDEQSLEDVEKGPVEQNTDQKDASDESVVDVKQSVQTETAEETEGVQKDDSEDKRQSAQTGTVEKTEVAQSDSGEEQKAVEPVETVPYKSSLADAFAEKEESIDLKDVEDLPVLEPVVLGRNETDAVSEVDRKDTDENLSVKKPVEDDEAEKLTEETQNPGTSGTDIIQEKEVAADANETSVEQKESVSSKTDAGDDESGEGSDKPEDTDLTVKTGTTGNQTEKETSVVFSDATKPDADQQSIPETSVTGEENPGKTEDSENPEETEDLESTEDPEETEDLEDTENPENLDDNNGESVEERRSREREEAMLNGMTDSERKMYEELKAQEEAAAAAQAENTSSDTANSANPSDSGKTDEQQSVTVSGDEKQQAAANMDSSGGSSNGDGSQNNTDSSSDNPEAGTTTAGGDSGANPGQPGDAEGDQTEETEEDEGLITIDATQFLEENKESAPKLIPDVPEPQPVAPKESSGSADGNESVYYGGNDGGYDYGSDDYSSGDDYGYGESKADPYSDVTPVYDFEHMTEEELAEYVRNGGVLPSGMTLPNGTVPSGAGKNDQTNAAAATSATTPAASEPTSAPAQAASEVTSAPAVSEPASDPAPAASEAKSDPEPAASEPSSDPEPAASEPSSDPGPAASEPSSDPEPAASEPASDPEPAASEPASEPAASESAPEVTESTEVSRATMKHGTKPSLIARIARFFSRG